MIQLNQQDPLIVCIDGGGTHSRFRVYDVAGKVLFSIKNGPASLSLPEGMARKSIESGLADIRTKLGFSASWQPAELLIGMAGASREARRLDLENALSACDRVLITLDGHAQLLGASAGQAGICLALGTGSVLIWMDEAKKFSRVGGWGYPVGDEAGSSWLGSQALNAYCWWLDAASKHQSGPLFESLVSKVGVCASDIQQWTTCPTSTEIASLAVLVSEAASQGDQHAEDILRRGALWCERLIALAPATLPIYLTGSLANVYEPLLCGAIRRRLCEPVGDALDGMLHYSKIIELQA